MQGVAYFEHKVPDQHITCGGVCYAIRTWVPPPKSSSDLWKLVNLLNWKMRCDGDITDRQFNDNIEFLTDIGKIIEIKDAVASLVRIIGEQYPVLLGLKKNVIYQLVALGEQIAVNAATAPDFLMFVKNEVQEIDLGAALS
jgi:hypothetical protein